MHNETTIKEGNDNIIIQNFDGRDITINKVSDEINNFIDNNNNLQKEILLTLKQISRGIVNNKIEKKDEKKVESFEKDNAKEVLDLIENLPESDFKANKKCLINELKNLANKKYKKDEETYKNFINTKTKQEFKLKIGYKIFNFINPEFEFSVSINELSKNPLTVAYIKCMLKKRRKVIFFSVIFFIISFLIIICLLFCGNKCKNIPLNIKVACHDSTICIDKNAVLELSYKDNTDDYEIKQKSGNLIDPPTFCGKKGDTIEVLLLETDEYENTTKTIILTNKLQYVFIKLKCKQKEFKPNILIKDEKGNNFVGEIIFTGIENQPKYDVINGKVDITNDFEHKYFNKDIKIRINENKYYLDTIVRLNDCRLIELIAKKNIYEDSNDEKKIIVKFIANEFWLEVVKNNSKILIDEKEYNVKTYNDTITVTKKLTNTVHEIKIIDNESKSYLKFNIYPDDSFPINIKNKNSHKL